MRIPLWRSSIVSVMQSGPRYRVHVPGQQELSRIVSDATADDEQRLGAAMALRETGDEGRAMVRDAAEAARTRSCGRRCRGWQRQAETTG